MRLLIAANSRDLAGGVETYLRTIVPALIARGHTVALVYECPRQRFDNPDPYRDCAAEWCLSGPERLRHVAAWEPEAIWVHGLKSGALEEGLLAIAPAVLSAHDHKGTCATGQKYFRRPRPRVCTRSMGAGCVALNFVRHCGIRRPATFVATFQRQRQRLRALSRYRMLMVPSRYLAAAYEQHGVATDRIAVLPYPLMAPLAPAPLLRDSAGAHVLMMARLDFSKGAHLLLPAASEAALQLSRPLRLTIAGDGPELPRLRALAARLRVCCDFPGWIDPAGRTALLDSADLLAIPSLVPESFGLVGLEAAARGVPAVAFASGGIPEWLSAGIGGELAVSPDSRALADAIVRALGDPLHHHALRAGAWHQAQRFRLADHLDRLDEILAAAVAPQAGDQLSPANGAQKHMCAGATP